MEKMKVKMLVEAGVMLALAQILSYIKLFPLPNGGTITAASMVPIIIFAIRWGVKNGMFIGFVYGLMQFTFDTKYSYHIISLLGDYFLAFSCLGFAGLFPKSLKGALLGTCIAVIGRGVCHVVSGAMVFAAYAPSGQNPWIYSSLYNASYLLPELIITCVVVSLVYKPLIKQSVDSNTMSSYVDNNNDANLSKDHI